MIWYDSSQLVNNQHEKDNNMQINYLSTALIKIDYVSFYNNVLRKVHLNIRNKTMDVIFS